MTTAKASDNLDKVALADIVRRMAPEAILEALARHVREESECLATNEDDEDLAEQWDEWANRLEDLASEFERA